MSPKLQWKPKDKQVRIIYSNTPGRVTSVQENPNKIFAVIGPFDNHSTPADLMVALECLVRGYNMEDKAMTDEGLTRAQVEIVKELTADVEQLRTDKAAISQTASNFIEQLMGVLRRVWEDTSGGQEDMPHDTRQAIADILDGALADVLGRAHQPAPPITPGEFLRKHILRNSITQERLADAMNVSRPKVSKIIWDRRPITTAMALRLARVTSTTPDLWLNLQRQVDLYEASAILSRELSRLEVLRPPKTEQELFSDEEAPGC